MQLKDALKRKNELKTELRLINQKIKELQSNGLKMYSFVTLKTAKRKIPMIEDWCCFHLIKE